MEFLYILAKVAEIMLFAVMEAMFLRAILSLLIDTENSKFYLFLSVLTEPLIFPVRLLFDRLNIGQNLPVDLSFFATYLLLTLVSGFMPMI